MSNQPMMENCYKAVLEILATRGMKYEKVEGPAPTWRIVSGKWKDETIHIRCSRVKPDFGRKIHSYGWTAKDKGVDLDYSMLVCCRVNGDDFEHAYIFPSSLVDRLPIVDLSWPAEVEKRIHLFKTRNDFELARPLFEGKPKPNRWQISEWEIEMNRKILYEGSTEFDL